MRTDFSEFSFGYALVEEFARNLQSNLRAAPIFPSLIEEGRAGGGYDVKFDQPGKPLLIQFKRPDVMLTARANEILLYGLNLQTPFYRFHIRSSGTSIQHNLLLAHDVNQNVVYYASPCFHVINDFDRHYVGQAVIENTIFIRPRDIGPLSAEPHHISYDSVGQGWQFSDQPSLVSRITKGRAIVEDLVKDLEAESRNLRDGVLTDAIASITESFTSIGVQRATDNPRLIGLPTPQRELARLSELSQIYLNAQLFIIQSIY